MPRSANRKYLELPTPLYEQIEARAKADGKTVAAMAAELITDGLTMQEWYGQIAGELHEIRRLVSER